MAEVVVNIPDDKVDDLVSLYQARYGQTGKLTKTQDKLGFLGKVLSHETVQIIRQAIIEQAQVAATQAIQADTSINKTAFETEQEAKALNLSPQQVDQTK